MVSIFKKMVDENLNEAWILIEQMEDDLALAQRLIELREDGEEYRAEKKDGCFTSVLEV